MRNKISRSETLAPGLVPQCGRHTGAVSADVRTAEAAIHRRMALACEAARIAGLPGLFRTWGRDGLMAVLATDPALNFLSTVSGITPETVTAAIDLSNDPIWASATPTLLVPQAMCNAVEPALLAARLVRTGDRILAVKRINTAQLASTPGSLPDVVDAGVGADDVFLPVLLAGYEVDGVVAEFISAEHRHPTVQRFLVLDQETPISAAAMTVHNDVAVLGGAATLPAHRGRGAQTRLLQHRLRQAAEATCSAAVATARPDSPSADNLRRAGFRISRHSKWEKI